ncbi:hypothetical protein [Pseudomonas sp. REB1044]|uniref:hypothetical protein n=1 Tax=Pseudomonas sp. REB1044 TaxID=2675224 RepID=UPI00315CDE63
MHAGQSTKLATDLQPLQVFELHLRRRAIAQQRTQPLLREGLQGNQVQRGSAHAPLAGLMLRETVPQPVDLGRRRPAQPSRQGVTDERIGGRLQAGSVVWICSV